MLRKKSVRCSGLRWPSSWIAAVCSEARSRGLQGLPPSVIEGLAPQCAAGSRQPLHALDEALANEAMPALYEFIHGPEVCHRLELRQPACRIRDSRLPPTFGQARLWLPAHDETPVSSE